MCGRFTSLTPPEELAEIFDCTVVDELRTEDFVPNFNVAPSTRIFAIASSATLGRTLGRLRWGLVPHWAKEPHGTGQINARSETIAEKPTFRDSFRKRRCIIPMTGYYEWRTVGVPESPSKSNGNRGQAKRAVYVTRGDGRPLAVAGLWSIWSDSRPAEMSSYSQGRGTADTSDRLRTCCVITRAANDALSSVHDRMPVVLREEDWSAWLGESETPIDELHMILAADPNRIEMKFVDVGPLVNSVRHNGPELIVPIS